MVIHVVTGLYEGMILLQFDYLMRPDLIPGPYNYEIDSFREGGKIYLPDRPFHIAGVKQLSPERNDFNKILTLMASFHGQQRIHRIWKVFKLSFGKCPL